MESKLPYSSRKCIQSFQKVIHKLGSFSLSQMSLNRTILLFSLLLKTHWNAATRKCWGGIPYHYNILILHACVLAPIEIVMKVVTESW